MKPKKLVAKQPDKPGNSAKMEAAKPADAGKGGKATILELAMLAAMIDPAACREGNNEAALFRAFALLEESTSFCEEWGPMSLDERVSKLRILAFEQNSGARHLLDSIVRRWEKLPLPMLTLAMRDREEDTIRPYLQRHANFGGMDTNRKGWSSVRTVVHNLRRWCVSLVNDDNSQNAERMRARDLRDEEEAKAKGCSVETLHAGGWSGYVDEQWVDAESKFDEFLKTHEVWKNGQLTGYLFREEAIKNFVKWKKQIRTQKGGMTAVRVLTRKEVLGAVK